MSKEDIILINNFITQEENDALLEYEKYLTENELWETSDLKGDPYQQWTKRFVGVQNLVLEERGFNKPWDLEIKELAIKIRKRVRAAIEEAYGVEGRIWADSLNLIRWTEGVEQTPHSDYENLNGEPHIYNWRDIGVVIYLNNDFKGGQIAFPQHRYAVTVEPRLLAFFPGDVNHVHGVTMIEEGVRYTLNMFYTFTEAHKDQLEQ